MSQDLVLVFKPTKPSFTNGALQSVNYVVSGYDAASHKETRKATFYSGSSLGPSAFAQQISDKLYVRMKADGLY
jgi:hypothetical protein